MTSFKSGKLTYEQQEAKHKNQLIKNILIEQSGTDFNYTRKQLSSGDLSEEDLEHILGTIIKSKPFKYEKIPSDVRRILDTASTGRF